MRCQGHVSPLKCGSKMPGRKDRQMIQIAAASAKRREEFKCANGRVRFKSKFPGAQELFEDPRILLYDPLAGGFVRLGEKRPLLFDLGEHEYPSSRVHEYVLVQPRFGA